MQLVWTTDPHLNHAPLNAWERWSEAIGRHGPGGVILTGDISEGDDVVFQLRRLVEAVNRPVFFVLGNHDFYESSIAATRRRVIEACRDVPHLHYLTDLDPMELGQGVFLVGEDGWGDAKLGDYEASPVRLNDFRRIDDFRIAAPQRWKAMLQQQGEASAERLAAKLSRLPATARELLVATHVPPFREACWYEGHTTDDLWAPFFVCGAVGEALLEASRSRPGCRFTVLCGHTHHDGVAQLETNLVVHTGAAEYGAPAIEGIIAIDPDRLHVEKAV